MLGRLVSHNSTGVWGCELRILLLNWYYSNCELQKNAELVWAMVKASNISAFSAIYFVKYLMGCSLKFV